MDADRDLEADLDLYLTEADGTPFWEFADGEDSGWQPADEEGADRLLRHLGRAEAEEARFKAFHANQVAQLDAWLDDRCAGPRRVQEGARRALESWARQVHPEQSGHAWKLSSGTLRLTAARESIEIVDEQAVLAWCDENHLPHLVKRSPRLGELKDVVRSGATVDDESRVDGRELRLAVTVDGDIVPGLRLVKAGKPSFTVKPAEKGV